MNNQRPQDENLRWRGKNIATHVGCNRGADSLAQKTRRAEAQKVVEGSLGSLGRDEGDYLLLRTHMRKLIPSNKPNIWRNPRRSA